MKREITFALIIWVSIFAFLELSVRAYGLVRGARNGDTVTTSNNGSAVPSTLSPRVSSAARFDLAEPPEALSPSLGCDPSCAEIQEESSFT